MTSSSKSRRRKPPIPKLILGLSIAVWVLLTWVGYRAFSADQTSHGLWGCEMAYMYPAFVPIEGVDGAGRYALYLYREGGLDEPTPTPSGHPVVFIPGNAGSYKQSRSIGSSAARQFHAGGGWKKPVDVFTMDFNEDFSALHAPTLHSQAEFLVKAITRVLETYDYLPVNERPSKVTLLGHSMGGIVARLAVSLDPNAPVDAIVTMSTPHLQPPAPLDYGMERIYTEINRASYADPAPLLVSICGGASDIQIVSDVCALTNDLVGPEDGFAVFSSGIPGVWTGVEHQAMVWCDQVRYRVARTLLDMGERSSRGDKLVAARKWLRGRSPKMRERKSSAVTRAEVPAPTTAVLVHLAQADQESLVDPPLSARFCRSEGDCEEAAFSTQVAPWLPVSASERPFPLLGEGSRSQDSVLVLDFEGLDTEGWLEIHHPPGAWVHSGAAVVDAIQSRWVSKGGDPPAHLALRFNSLVSSVVAYSLTVETEECSDHMPTIQYTSQPASPQYDPTSESRFYPLASGSVTLHSHISGSPFQGLSHTHGISIDIYQHPQCLVRTVSLSLDAGATLAKAMLRLRIAVLAWCVGWVGAVLFCQLRRYSSTNSLPSFSSVVEEQGPKIGLVALGLTALSITAQHIGHALKLPTDQLVLGLTHVAFLPLLLLVGLWSWGTVALAHVLLQGCLYIVAKFLPTQEKRSKLPSDAWTIGSRVATGLLLLGLITIVVPYRLAFAILYIVQFSLTAYASKEGSSSRLHLLTTLLLLMTFLLPFNLPALAVWGKNFWIHGQHAFLADRAIIPVLPALVLVLVSSLQRPLATAPLVMQGAKWAAGLVVVIAYAIAPRRVYILMPTVNVVFALASLLMAAPNDAEVLRG